MNLQRNLLCLAIAITAISVYQGAVADDFGFEDESAPTVSFYKHSVELGLGYTSDDNGKFGEFSPDLEGQGAFGVGAIRLRGGYDEGLISWLDAVKSPYNVDVSAGYKRPHDFAFAVFGYDSQKVEKFDAKTIYANTGNSTSLAIPSGLPQPILQPGSGSRPPSWVPDYSDESLYGNRTFKVERNTYGVEVSKYLRPYLLVKAGFSHQTKEGTKTQGNHENDAILPIDVDYEHNQFDLGLEFQNDNLTMGLSYYLSEFEDNNEFIAFETYSYNAGNPNVPATVVEHIATEPDNRFRRVETDGVYRFGQRTALNWLLNWSKAEQNQSIIGASTPGNFDGEVQRFTGRITFTSRPTRNFDYKLEFSQKDREAQHDPLDLGPLGYTSRDSSTFDKSRQAFKAQGGYRFPDRSRLRFGWTRESVERDRYSTVAWAGIYAHTSDQSDENRFWVDYKFAPIAKLNLSLRAETAEREGDQSQHPEWITPYYQDRDQSLAALNASYPLADWLVLSGGYTATQEDYDSGSWQALDGGNNRGAGGLVGRDREAANLDLAINASENLAVAIYTLWQSFEWEAYAEDQWGRYDGEDDVTLYGININWKASPSLSVDAGISISDAESSLASLTDSAPDTTTDTTRVDIKADWTYSETTSYYARALYEDWNTDDWANDERIYDEIGFGWNADDSATLSVIVGVKRVF